MSQAVKSVKNPVACQAPQEVFANALSSISNLTHCVRDLTHSEPDSLVIHPERDEYGRFISRLLDKPFIDDLDDLSDKFRSELFKLAAASD
ncbi:MULTISPECIES: hypothetical protein [Enterobacteriaceae]|uniref:hypothetical protein n=1 Tax=Enterobacteriaceae TaxID=543 RepID=UPI00161129DB|nr:MULTISPECIES: hypothetical protein [Enterobacteriaceae]EMB4294303.1 hypothetical protein [Enterobacter roggenkampii]MCK7404500.1 hypothetical protein [Enterobacter asburiae]HCM6913164.1 hypothetical protein [Klebsiella aerogenes]HDW0968870.1 hypothetical protein [Enterobacter hormaechei subsp. xiangfangensis]